MAASNNRFISVSPVVQRLILTSGVASSAQMSLEFLITRLCATAENLYMARDYVSLSQVADVLCTLPHEGARAAGMLNKARCLYNVNRYNEQVIRLLESASETKAAPRTKARAIQALGVAYTHRGDLPEASKMLREAMRAGDLITSVRAAFMFSELASIEGDHSRALDHLREIRSAVELIGQGSKPLLYQYANEVAFELLQVGRIDEARRFARFAISSPVAPAYPEWQETAKEIEQAEALDARNRIVRPEPRAQVQASRKSMRGRSGNSWLFTLNAVSRRLLPCRRVFRYQIPDCLAIASLVAICSPIRAPSLTPRL